MLYLTCIKIRAVLEFAQIRLLLQLMCWQDWLFSLSYFEPSNQGIVYHFVGK